MLSISRARSALLSTQDPSTVTPPSTPLSALRDAD
jgi:hypothetical protein